MNAVMSLRIPDELLERLKKVAEQRGTSVSMFIRDVLDKNAGDFPTTEERIAKLEEAVARLEEKVK